MADAPEVLQRPARRDDAASIAAFHHRCWIEGYRGILPDELLAGLREEDRRALWEEALAEDLSIEPTTVFTVDDVPVAFARIDVPTITGVYVSPAWWRRGLGRRSVREGERLLREEGVEEADIWTLVGNDRAVALYESEGWVLDGTVEDHPHPLGFDLTEQRLVKRIG